MHLDTDTDNSAVDIYRTYFSILIFQANFGSKMGVATKHAHNGLGPPNPTKKLARWEDLLGQLFSWNRVFKTFRPEPSSSSLNSVSLSPEFAYGRSYYLLTGRVLQSIEIT